MTHRMTQVRNAMQSMKSPGEKTVGWLTTYFGQERYEVTAGKATKRIWVRPIGEPALAVFANPGEFNEWLPRTGYTFIPENHA